MPLERPRTPPDSRSASNFTSGTHASSQRSKRPAEAATGVDDLGMVLPGEAATVLRNIGYAFRLHYSV